MISRIMKAKINIKILYSKSFKKLCLLKKVETGEEGNYTDEKVQQLPEILREFKAEEEKSLLEMIYMLKKARNTHMRLGF